MFSMVQFRELQIYEKMKLEYVHQILNGNNIELEPPIFENHNSMQIISSFAYCMHILKL